MDKNLVDDWGTGLNDGDYGRALAALGVLESSGTGQHPASSDPQQLLAALHQEFAGGERTVIWRDAYFDITRYSQKSWRETIHQDAPALAAAWRLLLESAEHPRQRPRLAVKALWRRRRDLLDLETLMGWLGADDTGCQALVLVPEEVRGADCRRLWHWPLHIGVPAGAAGERLLAYLQEIRKDWIAALTALQVVGAGRDACDLLILPPGMAAHLAAASQLRLQASFVLCLDDPVPWSAAVDTPQARLRAQLGAAGIAWLGATLDPQVWYEWLIRQLSHDLPVHAALRGVRRHLQQGPDVILGEPWSLDRLRILAVAEHLDRKHELLLKPLPPVRPPKRIKLDLNKYIELPSKYRPMSDEPEVPKMAEAEAEPLPPMESLSAMVRARPFFSEMADGMPAAAALAAGQAAMEQKRRIRHIQAYAWRTDGGAEPARALAPERPSLLMMHIGPAKQPRPDPPFPEAQIDFTTGPVEVTVQLELAGAAVAALGNNEQFHAMQYHLTRHSLDLLEEDVSVQLFGLLDHLIPAPEASAVSQPLVSLASDAIVLPVAGDSTRAVFAVRPQAGVKEVGGRIALIHQNRIVQTARLYAPVDKLPGDAGPGITVVAEAAVHPRLDDLAERRQFDAALIAADDLGGHLRLTISQAGAAKEVSLGNLKDSLQKIRSILDRAVPKWDYSKPVQAQPALQPILYGLASNGCLLFDSLREKLGHQFVQAERFQLLCRGTAFFPLEYVYAGPPPQDGAQVCPNAFQALELGGCRLVRAAGADGCPQHDSDLYLCPLHFWGFTKVIERHSPPAATEAPDEASFAESRRLPVPSRQPFGSIQSVLYAATAKAFAFRPTPAERDAERQQLADALGSLCLSANGAASWEEWKERVKNDPNLLVLIVHTAQKTDDLGISTTSVLEIGEGQTLAKHLINPAVIGDPSKVQLLLLIGCSTAEITEDFAPYHDRFRLAGADVILATLSTIRGIDALPMVRSIAGLMQQRLSGGQETAFGELLRDLRRQLFARGHPGVLGLVGFGDADWVLGGRNV